MKTSQRLKDLQEKLQNQDIINAIKEDNFSEEDYSNHSGSYLPIEEVH